MYFGEEEEIKPVTHDSANIKLIDYSNNIP